MFRLVGPLRGLNSRVSTLSSALKRPDFALCPTQIALSGRFSSIGSISFELRICYKRKGGVRRPHGNTVFGHHSAGDSTLISEEIRYATHPPAPKSYLIAMTVA